MACCQSAGAAATPNGKRVKRNKPLCASSFSYHPSPFVNMPALNRFWKNVYPQSRLSKCRQFWEGDTVKQSNLGSRLS